MRFIKKTIASVDTELEFQTIKNFIDTLNLEDKKHFTFPVLSFLRGQFTVEIVTGDTFRKEIVNKKCENLANELKILIVGFGGSVDKKYFSEIEYGIGTTIDEGL